MVAIVCHRNTVKGFVHMNTESALSCVKGSDELIPLALARKSKDLIPKTCSPATIWRWIVKGLEPAEPGEDRIRLSVTYVGRTPYVSERDVREFFSRCTQARLARSQRTQQRFTEVTDAELEAAGLR